MAVTRWCSPSSSVRAVFVVCDTVMLNCWCLEYAQRMQLFVYYLSFITASLQMLGINWLLK
jgi:hypothetical protein